MALTKIITARCFFEMGKATINYSTDTFKLALLSPSFTGTFNHTTHQLYSDIDTESQIANGNGYTTGGYVLTPEIGFAWILNTANGSADIAWETVIVTASGGDLSFSAATVYDDSHASKVLIGCIDFGEIITVPNGEIHELIGLGFTINNYIEV